MADFEATARSNTDHPLVRVDIDDIYAKAEAAFGVTEINLAVY
jgi:hypothetical protein